METVLIILILLAIVAVALWRGKKHFSGGGCCGSGSNTIRPHKELADPVIGVKVLKIQGMHCKNCQARIENVVDRLDGVVCRVDLKKETATITFSREISDGELRSVIERLGYIVTDIL